MDIRQANSMISRGSPEHMGFVLSKAFEAGSDFVVGLLGGVHQGVHAPEKNGGCSCSRAARVSHDKGAWRFGHLNE